MGHIKDLPKSKLSIDIEKKFEPQYEFVEKKKEVIEKLKVKSQKSKVIYLATDPDREGEAIAQHVKDVLENDKLQMTNYKLSRIVFHEITEEAVAQAIAHPREVDKNLVDAQIARRVLDRLVGYKLSPLLWKKVRRGLSAGRVQSVAVRLIVEKEREIEAFTHEEYWEFFCKVKSQKSTPSASSGLMLSKIEASKVKSDFVVKLTKIEDKKAEINNKGQADKIVADLEKSDYKVLDVRTREVRKSPFAPFTTSTLTQTASRFYSWSAKRTMAVAQKLYEEGLITYHRTDSTNISEGAQKKCRDFIKKNYGDKYVPGVPRVYKTKSKLAQEAHEGIRPTDVDIVPGRNKEIDPARERLYGIIWRRFMASQMADSLYDETAIDVLAQATSDKQQVTSYLLRASGQIMRFDGWRKVIPTSKEEEPQLPDVEKDEALDLIKVTPEQKFTQPPGRYSEASLIKTLEKLGIGRPSTYAPIITTIQIRQYVEKEEGGFKPTPVGIAVNDFLVANFPSEMDYSFTAGMENKLDEIANGERRWTLMMSEFWKPFEEKLNEVEEKGKRVKIEAEKLGRGCPECKEGELVIRIGRFGKFISCSRFPDCKHTEKFVEKIGIKCPECRQGDVIIKITKRKKKFYGCSLYPVCKWASWRKPERANKPESNSTL